MFLSSFRGSWGGSSSKSLLQLLQDSLVAPGSKAISQGWPASSLVHNCIRPYFVFFCLLSFLTISKLREGQVEVLSCSADLTLGRQGSTRAASFRLDGLLFSFTKWKPSLTMLEHTFLLPHWTSLQRCSELHFRKPEHSPLENLRQIPFSDSVLSHASYSGSYSVFLICSRKLFSQPSMLSPSYLLTFKIADL